MKVALRYLTSLTLLITLVYLPTTHAAPNHSHFQDFLANLRWSADFSSRLTHNRQTNQTTNTQFIGLDIHSVISNGYQDIATIVLQNYFMHSSHNNLAKLTYRSFYINFTNTCARCPNLKLGRFILPYGLEHQIDTAGELRDYQHRANLGAKLDWGISLNKQTSHYDYELSYTFGNTKVDYQSGRYNLSARISTPTNRNLIYGLSLFKANVAHSQHHKLALDIQYHHQLFGYFFEFGLGERNNRATYTNQLEINWRNRQENWLLFAQSHYRKNSVQNNQHLLTFGLRYQHNKNWTLETKINQALHQPNKQITAQLRYRY